MSEAHVYDKAKYHTDGQWPQGLETYQAFVHTGLFLAWLIERELLDEEFWKGSELQLQAVRERRMTGPEIYESNDGVFASDMLNKEGNAFTRFYYDLDRGLFLYDYEDVLTRGLPSMYHVEDTWQNYEKLESRISQRYAEWKHNAYQPENKSKLREFAARFLPKRT